MCDVHSRHTVLYLLRLYRCDSLLVSHVVNSVLLFVVNLAPCRCSWQARKLSSENLAGGKQSPVGPSPVRATSLEDIPTFASHTSSRSTPAQRFVDAVVKLYVPDHTYKYLDISPVSASLLQLRTIWYSKYWQLL